MRIPSCVVIPVTDGFATLVASGNRYRYDGIIPYSEVSGLTVNGDMLSVNAERIRMFQAYMHQGGNFSPRKTSDYLPKLPEGIMQEVRENLASRASGQIPESLRWLSGGGSGSRSDGGSRTISSE